MTVNVCVFVFLIFMEVTVFSVWLFQKDKESAVLQGVVSFVAFALFSTKLIFLLAAYGQRYMKSSAFWLELSILAVDGVSVGSSFTAFSATESRAEFIMYFVFFVLYMMLHIVRIFHIIYNTARPFKDTTRQNGVGKKEIHNVWGVWVGRKLSEMAYALPDLTDSLKDLPRAFSLQVFATRESEEKIREHTDIFHSCGGQHGLTAGRPDWNDLLCQAINDAHASSNDGDRVGVFCGSPAIARELQRVAQKLNTEHQYQYEGTCSCRILVHKENF